MILSMLQKPEKKSKKNLTEQLDLVETIEEVDKTKKKRLSIIIFLALTVGISLCFICYRHLKTLDFKKIKIPQISIDSIIPPKSKFSPTIYPNWSVYVQSIGSTEYSFSSNLSTVPNMDTIKKPNNPAYAKKYLPDGVTVSENTNRMAEYLEVISNISTPKTKFKIYTKIPGNVATNSAEIDNFSKLVEEFYWHLIKD